MVIHTHHFWGRPTLDSEWMDAFIRHTELFYALECFPWLNEFFLLFQTSSTSFTPSWQSTSHCIITLLWINWRCLSFFFFFPPAVADCRYRTRSGQLKSDCYMRVSGDSWIPLYSKSLLHQLIHNYYTNIITGVGVTIFEQLRDNTHTRYTWVVVDDDDNNCCAMIHGVVPE